ncbi:mitochondrial K+-H+ exchange-related-domain-containing protein [Gautieria morchelliformis]|nr:mitochondrial K+-H+ exchange-related-domain-containing protein [Gautieria morchelliformis]
MRIIALPLTTRATASSSRVPNAVLPLTHYHFQPPLRKTEKGKQTIVNRVVNKAAEAWAGFGKAPQSNWKRRVFVYGEQLIDRIDFEELSLQGVDPSLGPRIGQLRRGDADIDGSLIQIPIFYPPSADLGHQSTSPLPHMQLILSRRTPHHRKGFYKWLVIAPLTAPFALIPIIPNLPFLYAAWRAWSHYRAWKASEYLQDLIKSNHILPLPSPELDQVYASCDVVFHPQSDKLSKHTSEDNRPDPNKDPTSSQPRLLLNGDAIPQILALFKLPDSAGSSILRAIEQARTRILVES